MRLREHTTCLAVVDRKDNGVSWIQILITGLGSRWVPSRTGILLTIRMTGFWTDLSLVNRVKGASSRRTLNAPMVLK